MMRFGLHSGGPSIEAIRTRWQEADRHGFYACSMADHPFWQMLETWTVLAAAAAFTTRLRLCPLVLSAGYRHAPWLAYQAATLDVISGGRLILGLGAGWHADEHRAYGHAFLPYRQRVRRLEEAAVVCKRMWTRDMADFEGRFFQLKGAWSPRPVQQPHPPLMIGGRGRALLRVVARHAQIWNFGWDYTPEEYQTKNLELEETCRKAGRSPDEIERSLAFIIYLGQTEAEVEDAMRLQAEREGKSLDRLKAELRGGIVGTPDQVIDRLRAYERLGVTLVFVIVRGVDPLEAIRLFATEVLPAFHS